MDAETQLKIFGYVDEFDPLPGSWKHRIYELHAAKPLGPAEIDLLKETSSRMNAEIILKVIIPRIM